MAPWSKKTKVLAIGLGGWSASFFAVGPRRAVSLRRSPRRRGGGYSGPDQVRVRPRRWYAGEGRRGPRRSRPRYRARARRPGSWRDHQRRPTDAVRSDGAPEQELPQGASASRSGRRSRAQRITGLEGSWGSERAESVRCGEVARLWGSCAPCELWRAPARSGGRLLADGRQPKVVPHDVGRGGGGCVSRGDCGLGPGAGWIGGSGLEGSDFTRHGPNERVGIGLHVRGE